MTSEEIIAFLSFPLRAFFWGGARARVFQFSELPVPPHSRTQTESVSLCQTLFRTLLFFSPLGTQQYVYIHCGRLG